VKEEAFQASCIKDSKADIIEKPMVPVTQAIGLGAGSVGRSRRASVISNTRPRRPPLPCARVQRAQRLSSGARRHGA